MARYKFRVKPYAHQREGVVFALRQFEQGLGAALLFEPRTGKTKTTVDTMCAAHIKYGVRRVLVVAPNRVLGTWVAEIAANTPLTVQTIVWDAKARKKPIPRHDDTYDIQVLITNYETFGTPGRRLPSGRRSTANGRFKHRQVIRRWIGDETSMIVCDESHRLKNPGASSANMIVGMRAMFDFHMILTGTPITKAKRAADIFMQWKLINPSRFSAWGATYEEFRQHTGVWQSVDGIDLWRRPRKRGMRDLKRGIHQDGMVVYRSDCFDLPDRLPDRIIPVKLKAPAAKAYDDMARDFVAQLESGELAEGAISIVVTMRLSQITGGWVGIKEPHPTDPDRMVSRPVKVGTEKLVALKALLVDTTLETDDKVVICARYRHELDAIEKLCDALGIARWSIRGGMKRQATDEALKAFKDHTDGPAAMVVQPAAGGVGVDMSTSAHMIWYSIASSFVDWRQMSDRTALSPVGVQHTYLLVPGTVDEVVYESLQRDGDVTSEILRRPRSLLRHSR